MAYVEYKCKSLILSDGVSGKKKRTNWRWDMQCVNALEEKEIYVRIYK